MDELTNGEAPFPGTTRERSAKALRHLANERSEEDAAPPSDDWDRNPIVVRTPDGMRECFRIGALARAWDNRTVQSIYKLERMGILPRASYRKKATAGTRRDRLYTRQQIELIVRLAQEYGVYFRNTRRKIESTGFPAALLSQWPK